MGPIKLGEFITVALKEINSGILKAIEEAEASGQSYKINPIPTGAHSNWKPFERMVEFDVAITTSRGTSAEGGIFIKVVSLGASVGNEEATVSRVRFSVPVVFMGQPIEGSHDDAG